MKRIHLARVEAEPAAFRPIVEAAGQLGFQVGWLDLAPREPAVEGALATSLAAGFAVSGSTASTTTVLARARRGPARLRDVLRQGYLGCRLVLVRGALVGIPTLTPEPLGYQLALPGGGRRELDAAGLAELLRRPHPWPQLELRG